MTTLAVLTPLRPVRSIAISQKGIQSSEDSESTPVSSEKSSASAAGYPSFSVALISYSCTSSYCISAMSAIVSFIPYPVTRRAVQPPIPITIIKNLCLYRKTFRTETFARKLIWFQSNGMCSSHTLLPLFGDLGRIRFAAVLISSYRQVSHVTPTEHKSATASEAAASPGSNISS